MPVPERPQVTFIRAVRWTSLGRKSVEYYTYLDGRDEMCPAARLDLLARLRLKTTVWCRPRLPLTVEVDVNGLISPASIACGRVPGDAHSLLDSPNAHRALAQSVVVRLTSNPQLKGLLSALEQATKGELYIFGGTLRRALMGSEPGCDLDIMVPNEDNRAFDRLATLGLSYSLNRRRHRRYLWSGLQLDVNQPQEWRHDFANVTDVLSFFDLRINSLALHLGSGEVLDPLRALTSRWQADPGINWGRWLAMPPLELAILAIRLHRILEECPGLAITQHDARLLFRVVLPQCNDVDWRLVRERFRGSKADFFREFKCVVASRSALIPSQSQDLGSLSYSR